MPLGDIGTPNRGTNEAQLDQWNRALRASPIYLQFMQSRGLPINGHVSLSRQEQSALEHTLAQNGITLPGGMHIDQGGNLNQKNRLGRNAAITAAIAGSAFGGAAALGAFGGASAAGGGAAAGAAGGAGSVIGAGAPIITGAAGLGAAPAIGAVGSAALPSAISGIGTTAGYGSLFGGAGGVAGTAAGAGGVAGTAAGVGGGAAAGGSTLGRIGSVGRTAAGAAQGLSQDRYLDNSASNQRSQLLGQLYGINQNAQTQALANQSQEGLAQGNLDLNQRGFQQQQRQFALTAPGVRGTQAVRGSIMQNAQPASITGLPDRIQQNIPHLSGGLTPASFSPQVREMGGILQRDAIMNQLKGDPIDQFAPMQKTNFQSGVLPQPQLADLEKSGLLEKILGGVGLTGSLLGAFDESRNPYVMTGRG